MKTSDVTEELFSYLLSSISGRRFETVACKIFAIEFDFEFTPLGGMHDGGADGLMLFEGKKPNTFFQISVTDSERAKAKIKQTIEALRKNSREPKQLFYLTTELIPKHDVLIEEVFEDFGVLLVVKDRAKIMQIVNADERIKSVFLNEFSAEIDSVVHAAKNLRGAVNHYVEDPTIFAFLDSELKDRFSKDQLINRVLDSLIYWSLKDTDADAKAFKTSANIQEDIIAAVPAAKSVLLGGLKLRLEALSQKQGSAEARIRYYKAGGLYCLSFERRKELAQRALKEANLQERFMTELRSRLINYDRTGLASDMVEIGTEILFGSVHEYFVEQGLILSAFLEKKVSTINISDQVVENQVAKVIAKSATKGKVSPALIGTCLNVLRGTFYAPSDVEREYLGYLSRTSMLFMTLQSSPRLIEYFNKMGGNFRLLVGTDIIIKALSERYLDKAQRQIENLLEISARLGSELILTEPVLTEIYTHLHSVDLEYRNHYLEKEQYLNQETVSECDRILIRTYFHAKSQKEGPRTWGNFMNEFLDLADLRARSEKGLKDLRGFLTLKFKMKFMGNDELMVGVNKERCEDLATSLASFRPGKNTELSKNDALLACSTYAQRRIHKETEKYDGFGLRTWWLTKETQVLAHTGQLVAKEGMPYMMRPEFMLNFITLAPSASGVREAFRSILPTTVGLQLGQHLSSDSMHQLLAGTAEWAEMSPERRSVKIDDKVDRLKFDRFKRYINNMA